MNENTKTGLFAVAGVLMLAVGVVLAWPSSTTTDEGKIVGLPMFDKFKDPLAAANMRIVTYDSEQAKLKPFEVRREADSGLWTIPSRNGYPADAVSQMTEAANAFVGLKILDIQTDKIELHDDLGVLEPRLEDLKGGEDGVGRLVTFKDDSQKTIASLIIGYPVKDEEGKVYVRKPGEDPVYVVKFDDSPLTTRFQDWIEEDLLQLSSIEVKEMEIKDYTAALGGLGGEVSWDRNFVARVSADGSDWSIDELLEYDRSNPQAEPKAVELSESDEPNKEKLDEIKNALDDLKIVDVLRKPEGMSESLKASDTLVSDQEAFQSLLLKGFFPIGDDIISANGEMNVSLNDGVQYVLRFGNVTGLSEEPQEDSGVDGEEVTAGVNRYMLVTTVVDESQFPVPELVKNPETLEDLEAMMKAEEEAAKKAEATMDDAESPVTDQPAGENEKPAMEEPQDEPANETADEDTGDTADEPADEEMIDEADDAPESDGEVTAEDAETEVAGEADAVGEADGTVTGNGLDDEDEATGDATVDEDEAAAADVAPDATATETGESDEMAGDEDVSYENMTEEEKLELLAAEQEKIMKANQRKLDARNEKIEAARQRVRELNARFADWYYVIPETTYRQLSVSRDQLFKAPEEEGGNPVIDNNGNTPNLGDAPGFSFPQSP